LRFWHVHEYNRCDHLLELPSWNLLEPSLFELHAVSSRKLLGLTLEQFLHDLLPRFILGRLIVDNVHELPFWHLLAASNLVVHGLFRWDVLCFFQLLHVHELRGGDARGLHGSDFMLELRDRRVQPLHRVCELHELRPGHVLHGGRDQLHCVPERHVLGQW